MKTFPFFFLATIFTISSILSLTGQQISTVAQIYDYEVGDVFHVNEQGTANGGGFTKQYNYEIIYKGYTSDNETLIYLRDVKTAESSSEHPEWIFENYYDTVTYTDLDSMVNNGNIDTVFSIEDRYNGRLINSLDNSGEYTVEVFDFIEGCGGPYRWWEDIENGFHYDISLKYFHKGDEEWGDPLYVGLKENKTADRASLVIYPNPAQDYIILDIADFAEDQVEFDLVSVVGDIVKKDLIAAEKISRIDVSDLAPGLYIVKVRTNIAIQAVRFVKE